MNTARHYRNKSDEKQPRIDTNGRESDHFFLSIRVRSRLENPRAKNKILIGYSKRDSLLASFANVCFRSLTTLVPILVFSEDSPSLGQVGVREPPVTSHFSRNNAVMGGTARNKPRRRYKTRPHRYAKRCGRVLAQGGGSAEPWVFNVKCGPL